MLDLDIKGKKRGQVSSVAGRRRNYQSGLAGSCKSQASRAAIASPDRLAMQMRVPEALAGYIQRLVA
jgi:hypothetical protein